LEGNSTDIWADRWIQKYQQSTCLNRAYFLSNGFTDENHEDNLEQIDDNEEEDTKIMHGAQSLPDWIAGNGAAPKQKFGPDEDEIEESSECKCDHNLP
jgi:hypothetical protein